MIEFRFLTREKAEEFFKRMKSNKNKCRLSGDKLGVFLEVN